MIALDTNILVYSVASEDHAGRRHSAATLLERLGAVGGAIVPLQVIGELLNVARRKRILATAAAIRRASQFLEAFACPPTGADDLVAAAMLSARYDLQFFDALIVVVASRAGATALLSEDMQDGLQIDGLPVLNPFNPANTAEIDRLVDAQL